MSRMTILLNLLTLVLLLALAGFIQLKLVPAFALLMQSWGATFSAPARLSFAIADQGFLLVPILIISIGAGLLRAPLPLRPAILPFAILLATLFVVLQSAVVIDLAVQAPAAMSRIHAAGAH